MADKSFLTAFKAQLDAKPRKTQRERRLLAALNDNTPGPIRRRRLAVAEEHAKALLGENVKDWSKVQAGDWASIFAQLIDFIVKLMALFA